VGADSILKRDYSAPTGEDNFDKSAMPSVMQVGLMGEGGLVLGMGLGLEGREGGRWLKVEG